MYDVWYTSSKGASIMKHCSELLLQEMKTCSSCGFYLYNILLASLVLSLCFFAGTGTSLPLASELCFYVQEKSCGAVALVTQLLEFFVYFLSSFSFWFFLSCINWRGQVVLEFLDTVCVRLCDVLWALEWGELTAVSVMRHLWQDSDREVGGQSASQTLQAVNIVVVYLCFHRM